MRFVRFSRVGSVSLKLAFGFGLLLGIGCQRAPAPEFRANRVEWVKQERLALLDGEHFPAKYEAEIGALLSAVFGTPDRPQLPTVEGGGDPWQQVLKLDRLRAAGGPVSSDEQGRQIGLYREHCAHCHGITGDGQGPTAMALYPYPRDFRLGKFKFKSTPLRRPPTDDDLIRIVRNGIPGSAMPAFKTLPDEEVAALVDYVKYLSLRGEYERRLLAELPNLDGDPLLDLEQLRDRHDPAARESISNQLRILVGEYLLEEVLERWLDREDSITEVPDPPLEMLADSQPPESIVAAGRQLFFGKANCVQCHGATGLGDGQTQNYDDWANDWIKTPNVDPMIPETYRHFLKAGALPPRKIRPRNLRLPVYRGGNAPADLFRRIANGIEGTPMPSSPSLTPEEIWALVAYVRAMPYEDNRGTSPLRTAPAQ